MIKATTPNDIQLVPVRRMVPSRENVRLFVEQESLAELEEIYTRYKHGLPVVLPDAPILRMKSRRDPLEILAGERRVHAARNVGLEKLPCRVTKMSDEEAYRFIVDHNHVEGLTTAELAFRAAEMDRLGFTYKEIGNALQGAGPHRYIEVGKHINPDWFTDQQKSCDPSITEWEEAAKFGLSHFEECFRAWDAGLWDAKQCSWKFRRRGVAQPLDLAERGLRVTFKNNKLIVRGQVNLDYVDVDTATVMLEDIKFLITMAQQRLSQDKSFGDKEVIHINPETVDSTDN